MNIASVIVDIPTQALDTPYSYAVPDEMLVGEGGRPAAVGCAVLVTLGGRKAVGYIVGLEEVAPSPDEGTDLWGTPQSAADLKQVEAVLLGAVFRRGGGGLRALARRTLRRAAFRMRALVHAAAGRAAHRAGPRRPLARRGAGHRGSGRPLGHARAGLRRVRSPQERREAAGGAGRGGRRRRARGRAVAGVRRRGFHVEGAGRQGGCGGGTPTAHARHGRCGFGARAPLSTRPLPRPNRAAPSAAPQLTEGQKAAVAAIEAARAAGDGRVVLVDGVTGSGKTEVYLQAIERTLAEGRRAIVLVPEISLTPQTVARFRGRFGDAVAVMHSRMSDGERYDQWDFIKSGAAKVVVGARSALFTPAANVGLIVIDEEHEGSYKQDSSPRYHARDVAEWMMARAGGALVLGSATPSIESLYQVNKNPRWTTAALPERANGRPMPAIEVVDMAAEFASGSRAMFSGRLARALGEELAQGRKAVLLLNQRGFAKFLLCRDCGFVPECPHCSTSLTYHEQGAKLICHHCGYTVGAPPVCPECGSPYLKKFGAGTQRVETELRQLLDGLPDVGPTVPIIRMDADTTQAKGAHQALLEEFAAADAAVLLGTQMIAKGLDFDDVTLVGVINADTQLHLPDYRAGERTFQLIEQVAGRAGPRRAGRARHGADLRGRRRGHPRRRHLQPRDVPARRAAQAQAFGLPALRANGQRASVGRRRARRGHRGRAPARPAGRACPQRGGGALAGAAGSALRAGEAAQHLPLPHRGEGAFGRRYLGAAGAPVPHA